MLTALVVLAISAGLYIECRISIRRMNKWAEAQRTTLDAMEEEFKHFQSELNHMRAKRDSRGRFTK